MRRRYEKLGVFLRNARNTAELSQSDVARRLGYGTAQFVSNWERGMSSPPVPTLKKIAQLYKLPPGDLYQVVEDTFTEQLHREFWGKSRRM